MTEASLIHKGHRKRMREKLLVHGSRVLQSYELLEMLLFYAVTAKDTNAIAKRLLLKFGSIDAVFSASAEELMSVNGVGRHVAGLIQSAAALMLEREEAELSDIYDDYSIVGELFVQKLSGLTESKTMMMLFDNKMKLIACETVYDFDFSSGAVRADAFIDLAIKHRAAVAISAHNHPFGPLFPTVGDMATGRMLTDALRLSGVEHVEHYIVSGKRFVGISTGLALSLVQSPELENFYRSREQCKDG